MKIDNTYLDKPYYLNEYLIHPVIGKISHRNETNGLRRKFIEALAILASNNRETVTRSYFIEELWDDNKHIGELGLNTLISELRKILNDKNNENPIIKTIPRKGYQLNAEIKLNIEKKAHQFDENHVVPNRPDWFLKKLISKNKIYELWVVKSKDTHTKRLFWFYKNEEYISELKKNIKTLEYLKSITPSIDNVINVHSFNFETPPYYIEASCPNGKTLQEWISSSDDVNKIDEKYKVKLLINIAKVLCDHHKQGFMHNHLSIHNIYIDEYDNNQKVILGDFSVAQLPSILHKNNKFVVSKLSTLSFCTKHDCYFKTPTDINEIDKYKIKSDIYKLGNVIWNLFSGNINDDFNSESSFNGINQFFKQLIAQCIDFDITKRPDIQTVLNKLNEYLSHINITKTDSICTTNIFNSKKNKLKFVGRYRLLEEIGQGGMGKVFLAEERGLVQRLVAIKFIKSGIDSKELLSRFEAEQQALALMSHPNISTIFEAGIDNNDPYFVMEYINGSNIINHCDTKNLNIKERIKIFIQVCKGIMHAHQKGIIHRDLNPRNIMVNDHDSVVKIIDFGVAKSMQKKLSKKTLFTDFGNIVGTLKYSSPEQLNKNINLLDTRSDIYSLGVILFELLVGKLPYMYKIKDINQLNESNNIYISNTGNALSVFNSFSEEKKYEMAISRSTSMKVLTQFYGGEINWIISKCLEYHPDNRYSNVNEIEKDLRNYLENRPLIAKKISAFYRLYKYMLRNKMKFVGISSVLILFLTLSYYTIFNILKSKRLTEEVNLISQYQLEQIKKINPNKMGQDLKAILIKQLKNKKVGNDKTTDNSDQLIEIFNNLNFTDIQKNQLNKHYFDPLLKSINKEFKNNEIYKARILKSISKTQNEIGLFKEALENYSWLYKIQIKLYDKNHPEILETIFEKSLLFFHLNKIEEAKKELQYVQNIYNYKYGKNHHKYLETIVLESLILARTFQFDQAEKLIKSTLKVPELNKLINQNTKFKLRHMLGYIYIVQKKPLSVSVIEDLVADQNGIADFDPKLKLKTMVNLAMAYSIDNNLIKAIEITEQALSKQKEIYGSENVQTLAMEINLAAYYIHAKLYDKAVKLYKNIISTYELIGEHHNVDLFLTKYSLGYLYNTTEEYQKAKILLESTLDPLEKYYGFNNIKVLNSYTEYSKSLMALKDYKKAENILLKSLEIAQNINSKDQILILKSLAKLADISEDSDKSLNYRQKASELNNKLK